MSLTPYKSTVSDAASSIDLTTIETVRAELDTGEDDTTIQRLITQASQAIATHCNRVFTQETVVDHFRLANDGIRRPHLQLSRYPVVSIATVVEAGVTLDAAMYEFEAKGGFLWRLDGSDNRSFWSTGKVVVTFVAGFELLETLPEDVERACLIMVTQAITKKGRDPSLRRERVDGVGEQEFWVDDAASAGKVALPPEAEGLLQRYIKYG